METTGKGYENNELKQNWKVVQNSNTWFCLLVIKVIFLEGGLGTMHQVMYASKFEILLRLDHLLTS